MTQEDISKVVAYLTQIQVYVALATGLIIAWATFLAVSGTNPIAAQVARWYPIFALILPIALLWSGLRATRRAAGVALSRLPIALTIGGIVAVVGWVVATLGIMILASQLPAIFGSENAGELAPAIRSRLFWQPALLVAGGTLLGGLLAGTVVWWRARAKYSEKAQ